MTLDLNLGLYLSVNRRPRLAKLLGVQPPSPSFRQREAYVKDMQGKKKRLESLPLPALSTTPAVHHGKRLQNRADLGSRQGNRGAVLGRGSEVGGLPASAWAPVL